MKHLIKFRREELAVGSILDERKGSQHVSDMAATSTDENAYMSITIIVENSDQDTGFMRDGPTSTREFSTSRS